MAEASAQVSGWTWAQGEREAGSPGAGTGQAGCQAWSRPVVAEFLAGRGALLACALLHDGGSREGALELSRTGRTVRGEGRAPSEVAPCRPAPGVRRPPVS